MNYKRIYDAIIEQARTRKLEGYTERHHIIPKCLGGTDDTSNLVVLTPEEHFLCHILLVKIHPDSPNLILAVNMMSSKSANHQTGRSRIKMYGWLKKRFNVRMKELTAGSGNSQYGKIWVNDGITAFRINKIHPIPPGLILGRKIKPDFERVCKICGCATPSKNSNFCDFHRKEQKAIRLAQLNRNRIISQEQISAMQIGRKKWVQDNYESFIENQRKNSAKQNRL